MDNSDEKLLVRKEKRVSGVTSSGLRFGSADVVYFFCYAAMGWTLEVLYCLVTNGAWERRGYLLGPYCPIYGFGAIIVLKLLYPCLKSPARLFAGAFVSCSVLEYFTSIVMENTLHVRLWDYTNNTLNIDGRVCLLNSFLFGVISLALIYIIHPRTSRVVSRLGLNNRLHLARGGVLFMLTDLFVSVNVTGYSGRPVLEPLLIMLQN